MSDQLQKLKALLERVKLNAGKARAAQSVPAPSPEPRVQAGFSAVPVSNVRAPEAATAPIRSGAISGIVPTNGPVEAPEELLEEDIVEMTPGLAAVPQRYDAGAGSPAKPDAPDIDFKDEEEEPPASSRRPRVPTTMDEALAAAAEQMEMDEEHDVPIKTPPPESGPQEAMPLPAGIHAPPVPDVHDLLEADLPPARVAMAQPTAEQLGQTIDLEEAPGLALELGEPFKEAAVTHPSSPEELEAALPRREFGGTYDDSLVPPPGARDDLEAHRRRLADESGSGAVTSVPFASMRAPFVSLEPVTTESPTASVSTVTVDVPGPEASAPEVVSRPNMAAVPAATFTHVESFKPSTFLELLDASLALGRD